MENSQKRSLRKEIERDVQQIEKEIASHPELDQIQVTKEMDEALFAKIREYERKKAEEEAVCKDRTENFKEEKPKGNVFYIEASEELVPNVELASNVELIPNVERISKASFVPDEKKMVTVRYRKRRIRWIAAMAAVFVLVLGLGMTSVGSKSYWKELLDVLMGKESARMIDVEDMDKKDTEDIDEILVYREIGEKLGQAPVRMRYKPKGMRVVDYDIDETLQLARLLFRYNGGIVRYSIYASQEDSSWAEKEEDIIAEEYTKEINGVEIEVDEINKPNQKEQTKAARFEYKGMHYEIKGEIEDSEFEKILENLYFL